MKVLHINSNYFLTTLHQTMAEHLSNLGVENSVYVATYDKNRSVIDLNENVCVSECFNKWDRVLFDRKQAKIIGDIRRQFRVKDFDCIHAYTLFTDGNTAMNLSKRYGKPYVVAVRGTDIDTFFRVAVYLRNRGVEIMLNASRVFFLSEVSLEKVLHKYVPAKYRRQIRAKSMIVPNGIDDFWHENRYLRHSDIGPMTRELSLVYAGRIDKNKNSPAVQKAMEILRAQYYDTRLTVIGRIDDKAEAAAVRSDPYTKCYKAVEKERLINVYRKSDIFVMPSHSETFGLVYAEAMSQGLPVIYTKGQGFDGQFKEGTAGFAVDDNDPVDIAEKIKLVCRSYPQISANCTKLCSRFTWDDIVKQYKSVYESIV